MSQLSKAQEDALIEYLRAIDAGGDPESCLARYPQHAEQLRPYLTLRAQLLASEVPPPPAAAYQAGRQTLLERLARPQPGHRRAFAPIDAMASVWRRLGSPAARLAAAGAAALVLAAGALGASAAGGVGPARDVFSALRIVPAASDEDAPDARIEGDSVPTVDVEPQATAGVPSGDTTGGATPQEIPGVGLCFQAVEHAPDLPAEVLQRLPDAGLCVPNGLLEHSPEGRPCVPAPLLERYPALEQVVSQSAVCGAEEGQQPSDHGGPPTTIPAPTDHPQGPPESPGPPEDAGPEARSTPPGLAP